MEREDSIKHMEPRRLYIAKEIRRSLSSYDLVFANC